MTGPQASPGNGPLRSRAQAEAEFAVFRQAAERGHTGPPGEQLVFTTEQYLGDALLDTIEYWAPIGEYDRAVIGRLAGLLDPVEMAVVVSWFYRVHEPG